MKEQTTEREAERDEHQSEKARLEERIEQLERERTTFMKLTARSHHVRATTSATLMCVKSGGSTCGAGGAGASGSGPSSLNGSQQLTSSAGEMGDVAQRDGTDAERDAEKRHSSPKKGSVEGTVAGGLIIHVAKARSKPRGSDSTITHSAEFSDDDQVGFLKRSCISHFNKYFSLIFIHPPSQWTPHNLLKCRLTFNALRHNN